MKWVGVFSSILTLLFLSSPGTARAQTGAPVELPIEVLGQEGFTRSVPLVLSSTQVSQAVHLWMQVHGLSYENKASVRFNGGAWIHLNNASVSVEGRGRNYGGIGGGFATLSLKLPIPVGSLVAGTNTVDFQFDHTDERSIGYRVLKLNLLRADGSQLIPASAFTQVDPFLWTPPYSDAASIEQGKDLWRTATLRPSSKSSTTMRAHCMDCHTQSGMDLQYFAYSNHAIVERSKFHGLTEEEGKKIASYIRTLPNVKPWGRPWNPPYQPGPGLDSLPAERWAAGAGIDWVLAEEKDILPFIFPNGINEAAVSTKANLSAREVPSTLQLPDWNHWLPSIHPKDAWGDAFVNDELNGHYDGEGTYARLHDPTGYSSARARAGRVVSSGYASYSTEFYDFVNTWNLSMYNFIKDRYPDAEGVKISDPVYSRKVYSTGLWKMVKEFELMAEFQLDDHYPKLITTARDRRAWFHGNYSFDVSPNLMRLPRENTGINNNTPLMHLYFSTAWYQVALVLNNGNHGDGRKRDSQRPLDWPYTHGHILHLSADVPENPSTMSTLVLFLIKGMQTADNSLLLSHNGSWHVLGPAKIAMLVHFASRTPRKTWGISREEERAIFEVLLSTWLKKTKEYSPETWRTAYKIDPNEKYTFVDHPGLINTIWYMVPRFRYLGVSSTLVNELTDWAEKVFTGSDWNIIRNATCSETTSWEIVCKTQGGVSF